MASPIAFAAAAIVSMTPAAALGLCKPAHAAQSFGQLGQAREQSRERALALASRVHTRQATRMTRVAFAYARWKDRSDSAVRYALKQRGTPYRWGGTGRGGYDCSGLVQRSWKAAGVRIPRVTYGQYRATRTKVARKRLLPGDLIFFHGRGHVGMYLGKGRFIHSPRTGDVVRVAALRARRDFAGAVRPVWPRLLGVNAVSHFSPARG